MTQATLPAAPLTRSTTLAANARHRRRPFIHFYARRPLEQLRWKPALVLCALAPLTMLLTWKVVSLTGDTLLNFYGIGVAASLFAVFFLAFACYTDPATDRAARQVTANELPPVSFLVAVKDEVHAIDRCVRSMAASHYPDLQVIVVDDASTDGTSAVLDRLARDLRMQVIHLPHNVGKKRALVEAFRHSTGDIIVFTDSDCVIAPDAVQQAVRAIVAHPDIGGVSGHARALNPDVSLFTKVQDVWYDGQFGIAKAAESVFGSTDRQLTGYVLGQYWVVAGCATAIGRTRRPPGIPMTGLGASSMCAAPGCGPTCRTPRGRSFASRPGGRRASSAISSSPVPSTGAAASSRRLCSTATSSGCCSRL
ncbi:MAG: glycosyltransferase family 2 protein [Pseudonocardiaceae bacterium]